MMDDESVLRLARQRGIGDAYHDYRGELQHFSLATKRGILAAMGAEEGTAAPALLPPVAASNSHHIGFDISAEGSALGEELVWDLRLEDGGRYEGRVAIAACAELWSGEEAGRWISRRRFELPLELPAGYHDLEVTLAGAAPGRCRLIIAPERCHEPAAIRGGSRLWGVAVQLYTLRSQGNWGIGDFGDLKVLIGWLGSRGAGFVGLNPLHALRPAAPAQASPYSASNRHFLNVLYIAVPDVMEYAVCAAAQRKVAAKRFTARLEALRAAALVDYAGVAALKLDILQLLYDEFRNRHLSAGTPRAARFRSFVAAGGEALELHARFDALDKYLCDLRGAESGWLNWPEEFRDPRGAAATQFAAANPQRVGFFLYLQWLAHEQLGAAQQLARESGMPIGLYGDYAVGASPSGSETWMDRTGYRLGAEVGAPPDPLALKGQGWGLPPPDPQAMVSARLEGFAVLIRANMQSYGAMRIDHVMSLFRLWWVPAGQSPTEGAYVHYPLHLLFAIVALESQRHGCLVVGEDLGVVPDEMRTAMPLYGLYHYKVMLFEKDGGRFRRPEEYPRAALATVTTHDLPTLTSYWSGADIELRERLNLYPGDEIRAQIRAERAADREALLRALREAELAPAHPASGAEGFTPQLAAALHAYLARSAANLVSLQLEDLLGMSEPVNVPGTYAEYPNWQRKMTLSVEALALQADIDADLAGVNRERAGHAPPGTTGPR
jgi:4-alpha-glucanotransferase